MSFFEAIERFETNDLWTRVYQYIVQESEFTYRHLDYDEALQISNIHYNRYNNILPYDASRVKLYGDNSENTDYINASLITSPIKETIYIGCQHPLDVTMSHFWQMIWEQEVNIIVMLNRVSERQDSKDYHPLELNVDCFYGDYKVVLVSETSNDTHCLRTFNLSFKSGREESHETRQIYHFGYLNWPDFGCPTSVQDFAQLLLDVNKKQKEVYVENENKLIVHCSAGVGRTGTYILVDICYNVFLKNQNINNINPMEILIDIRQFRRHLVQTPEQLRFAYFALAELVQMNKPDLVDKPITLFSFPKNPNKKMTDGDILKEAKEFLPSSIVQKLEARRDASNLPKACNQENPSKSKDFKNLSSKNSRKELSEDSSSADPSGSSTENEEQEESEEEFEGPPRRINQPLKFSPAREEYSSSSSQEPDI